MGSNPIGDANLYIPMMNAEQILQHLKIEKNIPIEIFESIPSTNDYLMNDCKEHSIRICIAESQTRGKGRFQHTWHSPFGKNIYFSMFYPFHKKSNQLSGLSLVTGLAVCKAVEKMITLPSPLLLKWPNDLVCNHQKLGGILIELKEAPSSFCHAIIGIGLNVNMIDDEQSAINQPWTSLKQLSSIDLDRNRLCANLIEQLLIDIDQFKQSGLKAFIKEWECKDSLKNKKIRLESAGLEWEGIAKGIDDQGHLIIQLADGTERHCFSGESTLNIS